MDLVDIVGTMQASEPFYRDAFCRAVTGRTDSEWRAIVREDYTEPVTLTRMQPNVPITHGERFVQNFEAFMGASVRSAILDIPVAELYGVFERFRDYERSIHPRDESPLYIPTYDARYGAVESAYNSGDNKEFKLSLQDLVDLIIHD